MAVDLPHWFPKDAFTRWERYQRTGRYLMQTEVHVYAFSMAANILLSFFPFLIVMVSMAKYVLAWGAAEQAIYLALSDFFPGQIGEFIQRNLRWTVMARGPFQAASVVVLLFTANGIFEPLEVALNRAWGFTTNRSYFRNQLVSLGLIFLCGGLALISFTLTAFNQEIWQGMGFKDNKAMLWVNMAIFKIAAMPITVLALLLIYWLLPNGKVPLPRLIPVSVVVAFALELLKWINLFTWPLLRSKLEHEYGPFVNSATIVLWGFIASMVVLAGAEWAARPPRGPFGARMAGPAEDAEDAAGIASGRPSG